MLPENKYPIRVYEETPYNVKQHKEVKGKEYGLIYSVFNILEMTKRTLPILIAEVKENTEIIVVNDGSTDGTKDWLKTISNITVINCEKNLGIAGSQNKAIQLCLHRGYKHILFHDNDVIMQKSWIGKLRKFLDSDKRVGIVSPCFHAQEQKTITPHYTPTVKMVKADVFVDIGHYDERFTGFGSQCVDFAMRMYLAGWRAYRIGWIIGEHFAHATVGIGFKVGWWNDERMTNHNVKAWMEKWHERFNNSRPFLVWTGQKVKEIYGENWLNG